MGTDKIKTDTRVRFFSADTIITIAAMAPKVNIHERTYIMVKVSLHVVIRIRLAHVLPNSPTASTAVSSARSSPDSRNAASSSSHPSSPYPPKNISKTVRAHPIPPDVLTLTSHPQTISISRKNPFFPA